MAKILNYGSLNIDITFSVPHMVKAGETLSSTGYKKGAGGKGANQSAALAKAGLEVYHAGKIGPDGLFLLDTLKSYGVNTTFIRTSSGPTGQAIIQLDDEGQNSIILLSGGNHEITTSEIDETLLHFESGDYLVLQNEINNIGYLITKAKDKGMHIVFNPAPFDESVKTLPLSLIDTIVVNEVEGAGLASIISDDYDLILSSLAKAYPAAEIILTAGSHGVYYAADGKTEKEGIVKCKVVDTTAAGDTFIGFFLASKIRGLSPKECLKKASLASSIAVSRPGAMASIPCQEEVF